MELKEFLDDYFNKNGSMSHTQWSSLRELFNDRS